MTSKHLNNNKEVDNVSEDKKSEDLKEFMNYEFLDACKHNNLDGDFGVKFWIAKGADVNYGTYTDMDSERGHGEGYVFGLAYAATKNYPELCDWLLAHPDINVNMKYIRKGLFLNKVDTPLTLAVKAGHSEIVKKLAKAPGIDLNFQSLDGWWNFGESAAFLSISSTSSDIHSPPINLDCVKVLAEVEGVDWNLEDSEGVTPFMRALMNRRMDSVKCLKVLRNISSIDWNNIYPPDYGFKGSPFCYTLFTDHNVIPRYIIPRFLLTLPDVQVDINDLKERYCFDKAVMICKQHVLNKMKKKYKTFWKGRSLESVSNFDFLLFALQRNLSKSIVDLLVAVLKPWDIVDLVNYKVANDEQTISLKGADNKYILKYNRLTPTVVDS